MLPPGLRLPVVHDESESRSLPVVPNESTLPSTRRSNAIAVLQSGQKVTATGTSLKRASEPVL
jgi:hypothetical protein